MDYELITMDYELITMDYELSSPLTGGRGGLGLYGSPRWR